MPTPAGSTEAVANAALEAIYLEARRTILLNLRQLDPADPSTLRFGVSALLREHFTQKELAELVGINVSTLSRWAAGRNIPRSSSYRTWITKTLSDHLEAATRAPEAATKHIDIDNILDLSLRRKLSA
jgi:DNA-binding transcriptional regulator YiaG